MSGFNQAILLGQLTAESDSGRTSTPSIDLPSNQRHGDRREESHHRILYAHPEIDQAAIPPGPFRVLYHLFRRKGGKRTDPRKNPGIDSIAKICRMHKSTVEAAIAWLETNGYIAVHRRKGCNNRYRITAKAEDKVFIVPWLDDMGLSVHEFRVLAHISAVADEDQDGAFHVNETNFAEKCSMHRNTVSSVVKALEDHELIAPYDNRENPWYHLALCGYQQDHQRKDEAHPEGDMHKIDNGDCTNQITELKKEELKKEELKKALNLPMTEDSGPDIFSEDEEAEEQEPVATSSTQAQPSDFLDRYFDAFGSLGYEEGFSASAEVQHIEAEQRKRRKLIVQRHLKEQVQRDHPDCDVLTAAEAWGVKQGPVATNDIRPKVQRTHVPRNLRTIRYLGSGALFSG